MMAIVKGMRNSQWWQPGVLTFILIFSHFLAAADDLEKTESFDAQDL